MQLITDMNLSAPVCFGLEKLNAYDGNLDLVLDAELPGQAYRRTCGEKAVIIAASDDAGFMYGLLDLADALKRGEQLTDREVKPYLENRGLKFNIPLDARTPSYGDASTSATKNIPQMWEMSFWTEFLDRMAENRYNVLSLWTLSPFPSLVRIPEYPDACLDDVKISAHPFKADLRGQRMYDEDHKKNLITVKKITIDEKIDFWRSVMQYAADRCIRVMIFTWNVFVYGTEDSPYGLTDSMDNEVTKDFIRCGTRALMQTYPLLAGIGITTGENMKFDQDSLYKGESSFYGTDVAYIRGTYGKGVEDYMAKDPERKFVFIHRMQMSRYEEIISAYREFPCDFEISFKYSQAHMYSSTKPQFITSFLKEKAKDVKVWLTVRNDDYYMYRWGDPEYAREYLTNMPSECLSGFYMGPDGYRWGRDYATRNDDVHPLWVDKMWFMYSIWGKLSYDLSLSSQALRADIKARFGLTEEVTGKLYEAWCEVSRIIPELDCTHWHHFDFQWYPEGCCMYYPNELDKLCFANIHEFMECDSITDGEYASVKEYAEARAAGRSPARISPEVTAASIRRHVTRAKELLPELEAVEGCKEFSETVKDIRAMAVLGEYYVLKLEAAMDMAVFRLTGEKALQEEAVEKLTEAAPIWKQYSAMTVARNIPQVLTRMCAKVNVQEFDEYADLDILLAREG